MTDEKIQVNVNLSAEDVTKLERISQMLDLDNNRSACVRWIIRRQYESLFGALVKQHEG
jgi:hypothetical protein